MVTFIDKFHRLHRLFRGSTDGTVAVEFAFTALPFFMLIFGIYEIGQVLWTSAQIDFHTDRIVRSAIVDASVIDSEIQSALQTAFADYDVETLAIEVFREETSGSTPGFISVQVDYTYYPITPFIFSDGYVINYSHRYSMLPSLPVSSP